MKGKEKRYPGMSLCAFLSLVLFAMSLSSRAQNYPLREYTTDDGLPQSQSMYVMMDSRGYLWIPTRNGLSRFDGHTFTSYFRKDGLPSNLVNRIVEDSGGILWAITNRGVARFNGKSFHNYPIPDSMSVKSLGIGCVTSERGQFFLQGMVKTIPFKIILFDNGLYHDFTAMHPVLDSMKFYPAAFDNNDSTLYLIDTDNKLYKFQRDRLRLLDEGPVLDVKINDSLKIIYYDNKTPAPTLSPFDQVKGNLIFDLIDREGTRWMGTESKIYRLVSEAFIEYGTAKGLPAGPWSIATDPAGGLWIGSVNKELKYFDGKQFISRDDYKGIFKHDPVFYRGSATLSNGEVWISTSEGVLIWNGKKFRKFKPVPEGAQVCIVYEDPVDRSVFLGTSIGLYHVRGENMDFYPEMSDSEFGVVEGVTRDNKGNYWLAGHYGIVFFDGKSFRPLGSAPAQVEMVWGIIKDYRGNIWSAGSDGVFTCDPHVAVFRKALPGELNRPANVIRDMGDNRLLIGRMLDLCIIDLNKYYSGQSDYYTILGRSRGYNGNDCQDNGIVKDASGKWWLLTSDKLISFDPDRIKKNTNPPLTHITSVEIPGDTAEWVSVLDTSLFYHTGNSLSVSSRINDIRITYTGITTRYPEEVTYEYRISGLNDEWSPRTVEQSVILDNLPPGNYTFELVAFNGDGERTPRPETLIINVTPSFFQKLGVRIAAILMAVALIVFISFQLRRHVNENRVEAARKQAESYKLQLYSVIRQLDPHFTFNAVSSIGSLIMKGEKEKAYNYLIKLSGLLRSVLTDSSVLLKTIQAEIEFVTRFLELQQLRYGNRFDFSIKIDAGVDLRTLVPKMILQTCVENAVKHGIENKKDKGLIEIEINKLSTGSEFVVRDNGIGRKAASEIPSDGAGLGLKNIIRSLEVMNRANSEKATLTITDLYNNGKPSGTEVHGFLPENYTFDIEMITKQHRIKHIQL